VRLSWLCVCTCVRCGERTVPADRLVDLSMGWRGGEPHNQGQ
jgi:hypothetical protein